MFVKSAIVALLTVAGASASDTRFLRSLDPEAAEVECPLKDGEEKGRVLDCKKVKIPAAAMAVAKDARAHCAKFWTFNCDGKTSDKECMQLNARLCAPSKKKRDRCSLQKSKAKEGMYKQCKATEEQVKKLIDDFEADDTFDNWFAGTCEDGDGSKAIFKIPSGEDKEVDACAEAKASAERR